MSTPALSPSTSLRTTPPFSLTPRQAEANRLLGGPAQHILLRGGSRSGKTFLLTRAVVVRALKAAGSTHAVLRFRFNHLKASVINDTLPKVVRGCFPGLRYELNKTDWFATFPNGSQILFGGLDDKERTERILGQEHSTIYLNECSQLSYAARNMAITRLAQNSGLALKAYYDANPPTVGHWTYRLFELGLEPSSGQALENPCLYASMRINPGDNSANLPESYIAMLAALPARERRRFLEGEYLSQVDNALWTLDRIQRVSEAQLPAMQRVVIAVDPSGCSGPDDWRSDEIGIVAAGKGRDGLGYALADATLRDGPNGWAKAALRLFDAHKADCIVAERNFGGAMVEATIRSVRPTAPVKLVTASRGKVQRAEPVAALYEQQRVKHLGAFPDMEEQMLAFSTAGYQGAKSPDRADALIWGLSELMLGELGALERFMALAG